MHGAERAGEDVLLLAGVAVVVVQWRGGEEEDGPGLGVLPRAGDGHGLARSGVDQLPVIQAEIVRGGEDRQVQAQVADELRFVTEDELAHVRVQPVGAYHQVERACRGPLEGDLHRVGGLAEAGDGIAEDVLDVVPGGLVQDAGQVPPNDFYVGGVDHPEGGVHAGQPFPG